MNFKEKLLRKSCRDIGRAKMSNSKWIDPPMHQDEGRTLYKSCEIESGETVSIGESCLFMRLCLVPFPASITHKEAFKDDF